MSCSLPLFGELIDIQGVTSYLVDDDELDVPLEDFAEEQHAEDSWEWSEQEFQEAAASPSSNLCSLTQCAVSMSPTEELLAICKGNRATFLTRKWTTHSLPHPRLCYELTWNGLLTPSSSGDALTCVLCLPLASQQRSSQGAPDWTCVIAGFMSGYLRIYMQNGTQLIQQLLHDTKVIELKMRTKQPLAPSSAWEQVDELLILYSNAIVTIDGFSLYQSLKACRNQVAKTSASSGMESIDPPPLAYRKWRLTDHKSLATAENVGLITPSLFDRMQKASIMQNFQSSVKQSVPAYNHIITCGSEPFIGVYEALEGSSPAFMSEVAMAVASKLTSAMFSKITAASGWLGFSGKQDQVEKHSDSKAKVKVEKGTSLPIRFGLPDKRRHALSVELSPIRNLAAVTDNLGRVLLYDVERGIVVRMWKGYRDASCGWLVVNETPGDESSSHHGNVNQGQQSNRLCTALFLVIYAPRRGILEIWLTEQGNRVGAFNVGKNCRLLYPGYCTLGNIFPRDYLKRSGMNPNQCYLIEEDGIIKSIHVPFHCALSNIKSISLKDAQLLRSLSTLLERVGSDKADGKAMMKSIKTIFTEIQIPENQIEGVQRMVACRNFDPVSMGMYLTEIMNSISKRNNAAEAEGSEEDLEFEAGKLLVIGYIKAHLTLIQCYEMLNRLKDSQSGPDFHPCADVGKEKALAEALNLTESETSNFSCSIEMFQAAWHTHNSDRISPDIPSSDLAIASFVNYFEVVTVADDNSRRDSPSAATSSNDQFQISLRKSMPTRDLALLGSFLFQDAVVGRISISQLALHIDALSLAPDSFMNLLVSYAQSEQGRCLVRLEHCLFLHSLIRTICSMQGGPEKDYVKQKVGALSSWWEPIRQMLTESSAIGQCLITAVICRSVAIELLKSAQKIKEKDERELDQSDWVAVTMDIEAWNLLVNQLEDLLALYCFVHSNHCLDQPCPQSKNYENQLKMSGSCSSLLSNSDSICESKLSKSVNRCTSFSIKDVLTGGYDHIAQIASSYLVRQQVPGPCLGKAKPKTKRKVSEMASKKQHVEEDEPMDDEDTESYILEGLKTLQARFPFCLSSDLLWTNCAWECVMFWNDNFEDISMLSSALVHLSCIHSPTLKQGLAVIIWKAVYKDPIKAVIALVEKVGKAPKERLCRKVTNMGYRALERFLATCQLLLEIILKSDAEIEDDDRLDLVLEANWQGIETSKKSLSEKAFAEPTTNRSVVRHYWACVAALRLVFISSLKGIKFLKMFDSKGTHMLSLPLSSAAVLSTELDDHIISTRTKFCKDVLTSMVKQEVPSTEFSTDSVLISNPLSQSWLAFSLAPHFNVNEDTLWAHHCSQLYMAGLDKEGAEAAQLVQDKVGLASQLTSVAGSRLALGLLHSKDEYLLSQVLTNMPTRVTSWLQEQDSKWLYTTDIHIDATISLLQTILKITVEDSAARKFIADILESVSTLPLKG